MLGQPSFAFLAALTRLPGLLDRFSHPPTLPTLRLHPKAPCCLSCTVRITQEWYSAPSFQGLMRWPVSKVHWNSNEPLRCTFALHQRPSLFNFTLTTLTRIVCISEGRPPPI